MKRDRVVDLALLFVGFVILFAVPHRIGGDGEARFATLDHFMTTGHLASARYSVVMPLLASPLYLVGRAFGDARAGAALLNPILFAIAIAIFARELRNDLPPRTLRAALLLLVFASMFPNHVEVFYGEVTTALAVTIGVLWLSRGRSIAGWIAIVVGAVNTPGAILGVFAIAARDARRTRSFLPLLGPVAALALSRLESLVMRGSPFVTGYEGDAGFHTALPYAGRPGFSYPFALGVLAIVLSFGKGLVFFAPGLFVPIAKDTPERVRWIHGTLVVFVIGLVVAYAKWWAWYGGSFWGPRFFLAASVPACLALATHTPKSDASLPKRAAIAIAILLSFWVGVNGLVFDQTGLDLCWKDDYALEAFCHYVPEMSVLWHPLVDFASAVPEKTRMLAIVVCVFWMGIAVWVARDLLRPTRSRA